LPVLAIAPAGGKRPPTGAASGNPEWRTDVGHLSKNSRTYGNAAPRSIANRLIQVPWSILASILRIP
jgi:hypothetical protein